MASRVSGRPVGIVSILLMVWLGVTPIGAQPAEPDLPSFSRETVPSLGESKAVLKIPAFGRYSIWAESQAGVALQLVDKMAGPGDWYGEAGRKNGRIDVFLDRGEVLLRARGTVDPGSAADPGSTSGVELAGLRIERFRSRSEQAVELTAERWIAAELDDFEEAAWWLRIDKAERVVLEAAGRHLADFRLWRDGTWLQGAVPKIETIEPQAGRPLTLCRLSARLEPGLYRLAAYGGPSADWTEDDGSKPLYLRSGVPKAPTATRRRHTLSPFGFDRFLVPGKADYFRLELGPEGPVAEETTLRVKEWQETSPFARGGVWASITRKSRIPVAELDVQEGNPRIVTVEGQAGETVVLQHFRAGREHRFRHRSRQSGNYLIGTVHSGSPLDSLEATAILTRNENHKDAKRRSLKAQSVELRPGVTVQRRFNLQEVGSLFLQVEEAGTYEVRASGDAEADVLLQPFFVPGSVPKGYKAPPPRSGGGEWQLDPGHYRLTLSPRRPGILSVLIRDAKSSAALSLDAQAPARAAARFVRTRLSSDDRYALYLNQQPGVRSGMVLRSLPLDLEQALPLAADSFEPVELPFQAKRPGEVFAEAEDGTRLDVSVDGGAWGQAIRVDAGTYAVRVRPGLSQDLPLVYSLAFAPSVWFDPPPVIPEDQLTLPDFPSLLADERTRFELERGQRKTFLLDIEQAALYRLQSEGLIDTEGIVRTRVQPSLARRTAGGEGRNFALQTYLRPGIYQAQVSALGSSFGRSGLRLSSAPIRDGGRLRESVPARGWLKAGEALSYRFEVEAAGEFRLRTLGLGRNFPVRLEDADGWPLVRPAEAGDLTVSLDPGTYRWIVLPQQVDARQWTLLEAVTQPPAFSGLGPFELPIDQSVSHLWLEPESGDRIGDRWRFRLAADGEVKVTLSEGMEAELRRQDEITAELKKGKAFSGWLERGDYELRIRSARVDNRVQYQVRVQPVPLMTGMTRTLPVPSETEVAVGEQGLIELSSLGHIDVRARLLDASGQTLAVADDRPGDWNFRLSRHLAAGIYRLSLEAVSGSGRTQISMVRPTEKVEPPWALSAEGATSRSINPEDGVIRIPLSLPSSSDALMVNAESAENIRLTLESTTEGDPGSETAGSETAGSETASFQERGSREGKAVSMVVPLVSPDHGETWTLRIESLDQSGNEVRLLGAAIVAERVAESEAASGFRTQGVKGMAEQLGVVAVDLEGPGCFRQGATDLQVGARPGRALEPAGALVTSTQDVLWIAGPPTRQTRLERYRLEAGGDPIRLWLPGGSSQFSGGGVCDLEPTTGPSWVVADGAGSPVSLASAGADFSGHGSMARSSVLRAAQDSVAIRSGDDRGTDVDLRLLSFDSQAEVATAWGESALTLEADGSATFALPAGPKRLLLSLSRGLAAWVGEPSGRAIWAAKNSQAMTLETAATELAAYDLAGDGGLINLRVFPAPTEPSEASMIRWGAPFEQLFSGEGSVDLELATVGRPMVLRIQGARNAILRTTDGAVRQGLEIPIEKNEGGRLTLDHGAGWAVARLEARPDEQGATENRPTVSSPSTDGRLAESFGFELDQSTVKPSRIRPPEVVDLRHTNSRQTAQFEIESLVDSVLHLRVAGPVAGWTHGPSGYWTAGSHPEGLRLDLPVSAGITELGLRALGGALLSGELEVHTSPVTAIGEGLGPEYLLRPGETRFFRFEIDRKRSIGLGVHAEADEVEGILMDAGGRVLGQGAVQMHDLEVGTYLFALRLGALSSPIRARPAVAGLDAPGTGPPRDTVEDYLRLAQSSKGANP